jgi:hypothetical protein
MRPVYGGKWARPPIPVLNEFFADKCCQFVTSTTISRTVSAGKPGIRLIQGKEKPRRDAAGQDIR